MPPSLSRIIIIPCPFTPHESTAMKTTTVLSAIAALAATAAAAAAELKIDVTHKVECERKTQKGDKVSMHYRGTLAADGSQFDASASSLLSRPPRAKTQTLLN